MRRRSSEYAQLQLLGECLRIYLGLYDNSFIEKGLALTPGPRLWQCGARKPPSGVYLALPPQSSSSSSLYAAMQSRSFMQRSCSPYVTSVTAVTVQRNTTHFALNEFTSLLFYGIRPSRFSQALFLHNLHSLLGDEKTTCTFL